MIALIIVNVGIIVAMSYAKEAIQILLHAHHWVSEILTSIFSGDKAGSLARELIALLCLPILVSLIPALLYWVIKKRWFPYFMDFVWIIWLIQAGALAMISP